MANSVEEAKKVQEYICTNKESEELNDALRDLFDECLAPEGKQVRHVQWGRIALISLASAAVAALLVLIPVSYKAGMDAGEDRIASIEWVEVNVPSGQKQTVTLSDGTVLHLNSGSRLTYPAEFSGNSRTIFMDGEAFLDVAKNYSVPFV